MSNFHFNLRRGAALALVIAAAPVAWAEPDPCEAADDPSFCRAKALLDSVTLPEPDTAHVGSQQVAGCETADDPSFCEAKALLDSVTLPPLVENEPLTVRAGVADDPFSVLPLTQKDNPLITDKCRITAIGDRLDEVPAAIRPNLIDHIKEQGDELRRHADGSGPQITNRDFLDHTADCPACGPIVVNLLDCHVEAIRNNPAKATVFFDVAATELDKADERALRVFVASIDNRRVLVETRASFLSLDEDYEINQRISLGRAASVRAFLERNGVAPGMITVKEVTWTPPRLDWSPTAEAYGVSDVLAGLENPLYANQSVTVSVY